MIILLFPVITSLDNRWHMKSRTKKKKDKNLSILRYVPVQQIYTRLLIFIIVLSVIDVKVLGKNGRGLYCVTITKNIETRL